jgi:hypothetical protein
MGKYFHAAAWANSMPLSRLCTPGKLNSERPIARNLAPVT